jgi:uncharacterized protein
LKITESPPAFWDSSVLTTLCVSQEASAQAKRWTTVFGIVVWWSTHTEIHGAIARLRRERKMSISGRLSSIEALELLGQQWDVVEPNEAVRYGAARVLDLYSLRAADALQLAAALEWCRKQPKGKNFLCADSRLGDAAEKAGFTVLRP